MKLSEELRISMVVFIVVVLVASTVMYVGFTPRERFFQIYVLGEDGKAERYYPNDDPNVKVGTPVRWFIGVQNSMGRAEYVSIRVKLGNETTLAPSSENCTAANLPTLVEYHKALTDGETWLFTFNWAISEISQEGETTYITLDVNGDPIASKIDVREGLSNRLIFELWSYNEASNDFEFGWTDIGEKRCAWVQMWFNIAKT